MSSCSEKKNCPSVNLSRVVIGDSSWSEPSFLFRKQSVFEGKDHNKNGYSIHSAVINQKIIIVILFCYSNLFLFCCICFREGHVSIQTYSATVSLTPTDKVDF